MMSSLSTNDRPFAQHQLQHQHQHQQPRILHQHQRYGHQTQTNYPKYQHIVPLHIHQQHQHSNQHANAAFYIDQRANPYHPTHISQSQTTQQQEQQRYVPSNTINSTNVSSPKAGSLHTTAAAYMMNCYQTNANGWTGVPLISTASRRTRKQNFGNFSHTSSMTNNAGPNLRASNHPHSHTQRHQGVVAQSPNHHHPALSIERIGSMDFDENAMSRLAAHAHGAPLILSGRQRHKSTGGTVNMHSKHPQLPHQIYRGSVYTNDNYLKKESSSLLATSKSFNTGNMYMNMPSSPALRSSENDISIDSTSVQSDETTCNGNGITDNCLPRIIKPRKRRKKDRKPSLGNSPNELVERSDSVDSQITKSLNNQAHVVPETLSDTHMDPCSEALIKPFHCVAALDMKALNNYAPVAIDSTVHSQSIPLVAASNIQQDSTTIEENATLESQDFNAAILNHEADDYSLGTNQESRNDISCSCRLCDPANRIWAFPLRRSCSDHSDAVEAARRKNIGVIGGNRRLRTSRTEWRSSSELNLKSAFNRSTSIYDTESSDSGDSGSDILNALNFCDDVLPSPNSPKILSNNQFLFSDVILDENISDISLQLLGALHISQGNLSSHSSDSSASGSVDGTSNTGCGNGNNMFGDDFLLNLDVQTANGLLDGVAFGLTGDITVDWRNSFDLGTFLQSGAIGTNNGSDWSTDQGVRPHTDLWMSPVNKSSGIIVRE